MMENLSPEIWAKTATGHSGAQGGRRRDSDDQSEAKPPRPGDVLRDIGLVLGAHVALVAVVLLVLQSFGID